MVSQFISVLALEVAIPLFTVIGLIVGGGVCFFVLKRFSKTQIGTAREDAARLKEDAAKLREDAAIEAKNLRKEALLEAKEEQHRLRAEFEEEKEKFKAEFEKETKERRSEIQKTETRIAQKEELLDKKEQQLDAKRETVEKLKQDILKKEADLGQIEAELNRANEKMIAELEKVAELTKQEAKDRLTEMLADEAKRDAANIVREIENNAKEEGMKRAKEIVGQAIQKCATEYASEITVSVVPLPNDELKGRIIGRVGRNIRALESATGVDLIIDDTPDVVTLSGFDPVRREIARITLEKLIADGRIHPARIEEMVERVKKDVESGIKETGESAAFEAGIFGLNPELVKLLGRLKYRTSYGQNVLKHSLEVASLAATMATELGADVKIAKRAGLLHDIGKAVDSTVEGTHIQIGVDLAKKYKESKDVVHCIAAHHGEIQAETIEAILVQAADAISGARPGARRESVENYVKRLEKLENIANSFNGVEQSYAIQAGREIRVIVKPNEVDDGTTVFLAKEIAHRLENELDYPGQIKVNVIRELRSVEYAK
ncbi:MAG: ribonuclease Y [Clostridiales bacterium]|jgi:ribonuclease Y|nr:ribonuclease Y [Clostridiales bacterium]